MTARQLQPCGTDAAWQRHYRRGEPIDEACWEAHRTRVAAGQRAARAKGADLPPCTAYGCPRKPREGAHGWCSACHQRWLHAGRPAEGPPPPPDPAGRREDYDFLRDNGEPVLSAAQRVGVAEGTARNWETLRRQAVTS